MLPDYLFARIKVIFFDAEGTLFTIHPSVGHIYATVGEKFGVKASPEAIQKKFFEIYRKSRNRWEAEPESCFEGWREVFLKTMEAFGRLEDPEAAFKYCYECFARKEFFRTVPEVKETLELLRERGRRLSIISNWDERLRRLLKELALDHYFEEIFISCETGLAKPDPAIFELACRKLDVSPEEALMVGDSLEDDVLGARTAGLWALRYPGGSLKRLFCRSKKS